MGDVVSIKRLRGNEVCVFKEETCLWFSNNEVGRYGGRFVYFILWGELSRCLLLFKNEFFLFSNMFVSFFRKIRENIREYVLERNKEWIRNIFFEGLLMNLEEK